MPLQQEVEIEELRKQLWGTQQMLGYVLKEIGEPVLVKKADLDAQLPEGTQVKLEESGEYFSFSVEIPDA